MKRYVIIRNRESDRNVAVLVHEPKLGRVVFKVRSADWPLQRAFDVWADRTLTVQQPEKLPKGPTVLVRKKIVRFDDRYADHLADRFVRRPYEVRATVESRSTIRLDDYADKTFKEVVT